MQQPACTEAVEMQQHAPRDGGPAAADPGMFCRHPLHQDSAPQLRALPPSLCLADTGTAGNSSCVQGSEQQQDGSPHEVAAPLLSREEEHMLVEAEALKAEGNRLYGEGRYGEAARKYEEAIEAGGFEGTGSLLDSCMFTFQMSMQFISYRMYSFGRPVDLQASGLHSLTT